MITEMVEVLRREYSIDVMEKTRKAEIVIPRAALFNVCRGYYSASALGKYFGKNHATILHHFRGHDSLMRLPQYLEVYKRLHEVLEKHNKEVKAQRMTLENKYTILLAEVKVLRKKLKDYAEEMDQKKEAPHVHQDVHHGTEMGVIEHHARRECDPVE